MTVLVEIEEEVIVRVGGTLVVATGVVVEGTDDVEGDVETMFGEGVGVVCVFVEPVLRRAAEDPLRGVAFADGGMPGR